VITCSIPGRDMDFSLRDHILSPSVAHSLSLSLIQCPLGTTTPALSRHQCECLKCAELNLIFWRQNMKVVSNIIQTLLDKCFNSVSLCFKIIITPLKDHVLLVRIRTNTLLYVHSEIFLIPCYISIHQNNFIIRWCVNRIILIISSY
jgi:hypothetical protein